MNLVKLLLRQWGAAALTEREVAVALDVTETQRLRIADVVRRTRPSWRERLQALFAARPRQEPLRAKLRSVQEELDQPITALLNDGQREKLARLIGDKMWGDCPQSPKDADVPKDTTQNSFGE